MKSSRTTLNRVDVSTRRYLTFSLGTELYGIPVLNVREIIRLCPITRLPRVQPHVSGVINLRGTVIAVLDLRSKFQLPHVQPGERACIIVVQINGHPGQTSQLGFIVDAVEEVVQVGPSDIEAPPDFGGVPATHFIQGVATLREGVTLLLNIERIISEDGPIALPHIPGERDTIDTNSKQ